MRDINVVETKELISRAKNGDSIAFGKLYELYFVPVFRYVYIRVGKRVVAEDIASEVFLKAFGAIGQYEDRGQPLLAYLYTIARNATIDYLRKKREVRIDNVGEIESQEKIEDSVQSREDGQILIRAMNVLSDEAREALTLKYISGLKNAEIAKIMGKSEVNVRKIQSRAIKIMKVTINER